MEVVLLLFLYGENGFSPGRGGYDSRLYNVTQATQVSGQGRIGS